MRKQDFYILYAEKNRKRTTDKQEVHLKLVKTYANNFCINEDDQCEIIAFKALKCEISETNFARRLQRYLNPVKYYKYFKSEEFQAVRAAANKAVEYITRKTESGQFNLHFISGIPENTFYKHIAKYGVYSKDSKIMVTFLDGHIGKCNSNFDPNQLNNKLTVGDDIDLLNDQSDINSDEFPVESKCLSVYKKSDNSSEKIKCNRKTYRDRDGNWSFRKLLLSAHYFSGVFSWILDALISDWFDYAISKIFDFDDKPLLGFLCGFFLVFLIILRLLVLILVLYIIGKCMMFYYAGVGILFIPSTKYFRPIFYIRIGLIY